MGTRKTTSQLKDATAIEAGVSESSGKRAALYLRRSAIHERGDTTSIDYQREACERIAAQHGLTVTTEFNEGSGLSASHFKENERPEYDRAVAGLGVAIIESTADRRDRGYRLGTRYALPALDFTAEVQNWQSKRR